MTLTPEQIARKKIDEKLLKSGWIIQYFNRINPSAGLGVVVREFPTSTGPVDYAIFVAGQPVGVIEAKKDEAGENITVVEGQSGRYANSKLKYVSMDYRIRFVYEAKYSDGFEMSRNEIETSKDPNYKYYIYRVYNLDPKTRKCLTKVYEGPVTEDKFNLVSTKVAIYQK